MSRALDLQEYYLIRIFTGRYYFSLFSPIELSLDVMLHIPANMTYIGTPHTIAANPPVIAPRVEAVPPVFESPKLIIF